VTNQKAGSAPSATMETLPGFPLAAATARVAKRRAIGTLLRGYQPCLWETLRLGCLPLQPCPGPHGQKP